MTKPVLVVMAAGMGSRYGGLKQMDPIDAAGNFIIDYSVHDAIAAGFEDIVFVVKKAIYDGFRETIGHRLEKRANVIYAFQEIDDVPCGVVIPEGRVKPWGTTHAVIAAYDKVPGRYIAVINSDDYYGISAYRTIYDYLAAAPDDHALVAWRIENTLTENGSVSRGVCNVKDGMLADIDERKKIIMRPDGTAAYTLDGDTYTDIPRGTSVSMNYWGFAPSLEGMLRERFARNIVTGIASDPLKYEDLLPEAVKEAMAKGRARVKVLESGDKWFGVTHKEDKPKVEASFADMKNKGIYSERLWD